MNAASGQPARSSRWQVQASYVAAFGMIICFAAILIQFLGWADPSLDGRGMLLACALASLEAFFSFWLLGQLSSARSQIFMYRGTEVLILLIILKFFTELRAGPASFWNNFLLWPVDFPLNLLTWHYLLTVLAVLAAWQAGTLFATDLALLGADEDDFLDERLKNTTIRELIQRRFLRLGLLVVVLAAIPTQSVLGLPLPVVSNTVPAGIAYFVLGIILLSLTRYITLENTWVQEKLKIPVQIPRRWFAYSGLILAILIFLIIWLPTNYGLGFFAAMMNILRVLYQVGVDFFFLIQLVIALISHLLGRTPTLPQGQVPQLTMPTPQPLPQAKASPINWDMVKSVLLWGSLIFLAIIALRQYISFNQDLSEELRRFRPLRWLVNAWQRFKAGFRKANRSIGTFVQNSLQRLRRLTPEAARTDGEWDYINPRRLSSRQKVLFYYFALVRRAREAGLPRQETQTPYEYALALAPHMGEEKPGVDSMTEAFIEARYTRHNIPAKAARQTESIWEALRKVLKNVRKGDREEKPNQV